MNNTASLSYLYLLTHVLTIVQICTEPPSVEEECKYVLIGDVARKNGEKKLRGLLSCTPEWRSTESRLRLSEKVKATYPNMMALSVALQQRDLTALRKAHLLCMCREWRFRSSIWQPRNRRTQPNSNGNGNASGQKRARPSSSIPNEIGICSPHGMGEIPGRHSLGESTLDIAGSCSGA